MDKQDVVYPNNEIPFFNKEQNTDVCFNIDKPQNIMIKKFGAHCMIAFLWNVQKKQMYRDSRLVEAGVRVGIDCESACYFEDGGNVLKLIVMFEQL